MDGDDVPCCGVFGFGMEEEEEEGEDLERREARADRERAMRFWRACRFGGVGRGGGLSAGIVAVVVVFFFGFFACRLSPFLYPFSPSFFFFSSSPTLPNPFPLLPFLVCFFFWRFLTFGIIGGLLRNKRIFYFF